MSNCSDFSLFQYYEKFSGSLKQFFLTLCQNNFLPFLDSFVPICKEEYEKNLAANEEILNKAIDEVVAKQLDLGIDISMNTLVEHSVTSDFLLYCKVANSNTSCLDAHAGFLRFSILMYYSLLTNS